MGAGSWLASWLGSLALSDAWCQSASGLEPGLAGDLDATESGGDGFKEEDV